MRGLTVFHTAGSQDTDIHALRSTDEFGKVTQTDRREMGGLAASEPRVSQERWLKKGEVVVDGGKP